MQLGLPMTPHSHSRYANLRSDQIRGERGMPVKVDTTTHVVVRPRQELQDASCPCTGSPSRNQPIRVDGSFLSKVMSKYRVLASAARMLKVI